VNRLAFDLRAFAAAALKELRITRRYPAMYLGMIFWPVLLPAVWVLMAQAYSGANDARAIAAFAARAGTMEIAGFVFVGYAMYMWLSTILWGPGTALRREQMQGSLEAVFLTPTSRLVPLFAPPMAALPNILLTFGVMGLAMWLLFGVVPASDAAIRAVIITVIGLPAMYAIGALFAACVLRFGEIGPVVQIVRGTFVLACGITFPVAMLPAWAQVGAAFLPPTYIVADIRAVLFRGFGLVDVGGDVLVTLTLTAVIAVLAVLLFRALEMSARRTGTLSRF
jgi:ABC-2 type transport system permease protein